MVEFFRVILLEHFLKNFLMIFDHLFKLLCFLWFRSVHLRIRFKVVPNVGFFHVGNFPLLINLWLDLGLLFDLHFLELIFDPFDLLIIVLVFVSFEIDFRFDFFDFLLFNLFDLLSVFLELLL